MTLGDLERPLCTLVHYVCVSNGAHCANLNYDKTHYSLSGENIAEGLYHLPVKGLYRL